jgi:hypothetical protein
MRELSDYESIKNWTSGFSKATKYNYLRFFKLFCEFAERDPDQLMDWVKQNKTEVHQKAKEFHRRIDEHGISSTSDPGFGYIVVRSFFVHNDYPLGISCKKYLQLK